VTITSALFRHVCMNLSIFHTFSGTVEAFCSLTNRIACFSTRSSKKNFPRKQTKKLYLDRSHSATAAFAIVLDTMRRVYRSSLIMRMSTLTSLIVNLIRDECARNEQMTMISFTALFVYRASVHTDDISSLSTACSDQKRTKKVSKLHRRILINLLRFASKRE
jgi:hypothetical protein